MTTKEAIEWLNCLKEIHEDDISDALGTWYKDIKNDHNEVIDMAIEALNHSEIPNSSEPKCADGCIYGWGSSECGHCDYRSEEPKTGDCISRQAALAETVHMELFGRDFPVVPVGVLKALPSAQPERDIPVKLIETTDKAWGIPKRQAVCPKCDYYLGHVAFLGDYKGKRITYCEVCGQAIDWEGWEFDE